jgi:hypothetical protein
LGDGAKERAASCGLTFELRRPERTDSLRAVRIPLIADTHSKLIADSVPDDRGHL